jgi:hypothetical protein
MCIFCGGQCGLAEFFISIGLPFLGLYFYRIRNSLVGIKNKIIRRSSGAKEIQAETITCTCCGESLNDCRDVSPLALDPKNLELIEVKSQHNGTAENSTRLTNFPNPINLEKKAAPRGVRGWLLLLCLLLTILIPGSYLYEIISIFYLINSPFNQIILLVSKNLLLYHMVIIGIMGFLAAFSFFAGLQLWEVKSGAVKIVKIFLIIQLFMVVIIAVLQSFMTFPFGGTENNFTVIIKTIIPSLLQAILWFSYLSYSGRVHNTFILAPATH